MNDSSVEMITMFGVSYVHNVYYSNCITLIVLEDTERVSKVNWVCCYYHSIIITGN